MTCTGMQTGNYNVQWPGRGLFTVLACASKCIVQTHRTHCFVALQSKQTSEAKMKSKTETRTPNDKEACTLQENARLCVQLCMHLHMMITFSHSQTLTTYRRCECNPCNPCKRKQMCVYTRWWPIVIVIVSVVCVTTHDNRVLPKHAPAWSQEGEGINSKSTFNTHIEITSYTHIHTYMGGRTGWASERWEFDVFGNRDGIDTSLSFCVFVRFVFTMFSPLKFSSNIGNSVWLVCSCCTCIIAHEIECTHDRLTFIAYKLNCWKLLLSTLFAIAREKPNHPNFHSLNFRINVLVLPQSSRLTTLSL